jgi:DNA-3-methyladenine glycosylase
VTLVAQEVLGKLLVRKEGRRLAVGRIVEAEAYLACGDDACHASKGRNRKNGAMFGPPGHAYVYVIHARHCVNLVTEPEGVPSAVLVRALEPISGLDLMHERRGTEAILDLARGPARLCEALAIDRALDGWDLTRGQKLWLADDPAAAPFEIRTSPRIGVTSAFDLPLRFYVAGNRFVSKLKRGES